MLTWPDTRCLRNSDIRAFHQGTNAQIDKASTHEIEITISKIVDVSSMYQVAHAIQVVIA